MIPVELILLGLSPIFLLCVFVEFKKARQFYNIKDSLNNAVLALLHQGSDALVLLLLLPVFNWLHHYALWKIELTAASLVVGFILQDFLYYWFHRASHNIHWFWVAHVVHHSSTRMNFTTAFRQSVLYPIVGMWLFWLPMIMIGFSPTVVFAIVAINLAYQFFVHTQTVGNLGWFEHIFNTPTHHRIHHAINKPYIDKNYAGVLIIWDKLFGTFAAEDKSITIKYGIVGELPDDNPLSANFKQVGVLAQQLQREKKLSDKLRVLFGYPNLRSTSSSRNV
ncbi:sterol desaturase family protein [Alteromonas sp. D210916BOD_24]|uniref:sterol desaturase family protein n=1 Tax=Alteromonas sp. D210916BOD_24 TaxID=3157618 RepID=UPI00399D507A